MRGRALGGFPHWDPRNMTPFLSSPPSPIEVTLAPHPPRTRPPSHFPWTQNRDEHRTRMPTAVSSCHHATWRLRLDVKHGTASMIPEIGFSIFFVRFWKPESTGRRTITKKQQGYTRTTVSLHAQTGRIESLMPYNQDLIESLPKVEPTIETVIVGCDTNQKPTGAPFIILVAARKIGGRAARLPVGWCRWTFGSLAFGTIGHRPA